jgi:hypothetical protein
MEPQRLRPMDLPMGRDPLAVRRRIEAMEQLLERSFVIPGINRAIGLDALAGLVPVLGDVITAAMGAYIVWEALDTALGAIPIAGDLFDVLFRSNTRNLKIVRRHLDKHHPLIER